MSNNPFFESETFVENTDPSGYTYKPVDWDARPSADCTMHGGYRGGFINWSSHDNYYFWASAYYGSNAITTTSYSEYMSTGSFQINVGVYTYANMSPEFYAKTLSGENNVIKNNLAGCDWDSGRGNTGTGMSTGEPEGKKNAANGGGDSNPWALASVGAIALAADDVTGIGAVDDIAIPILFAAAATYDLTQRVFVTYTLTNASGQKYVGRASGFGDPTSVMMRRYAGHHMQMYGYGNPTLDVWIQGAQGYPAIRGREQQLIDFYGGVSNTGNSIRAVGYYNPMGRVYHSASNLYFGPIAPYTGY